MENLRGQEWNGKFVVDRNNNYFIVIFYISIRTGKEHFLFSVLDQSVNIKKILMLQELLNTKNIKRKCRRNLVSRRESSR